MIDRLDPPRVMLLFMLFMLWEGLARAMMMVYFTKFTSKVIRHLLRRLSLKKCFVLRASASEFGDR